MSEYLILVYDAEEPYANATPELWQQVMQTHRQFADHVVEKGGKILGERALQPTKTARSVRSHAVIDGPFVQTKEVFCGYYLIEASDFDQAVEIAQLCPAMFGGVEVRPIMNTSNW